MLFQVREYAEVLNPIVTALPQIWNYLSECLIHSLIQQYPFQHQQLGKFVGRTLMCPWVKHPSYTRPSIQSDVVKECPRLIPIVWQVSGRKSWLPTVGRRCTTSMPRYTHSLLDNMIVSGKLRPTVASFSGSSSSGILPLTITFTAQYQLDFAA